MNETNYNSIPTYETITEKGLKAMKLHSTCIVDLGYPNSILITKVIGGWIYNNSVFVPYTK
jgi:hypothetical protein